VVVTDTASHGPLSGVAAIAAGGYHTCALITGGGVKCWGRNDYGQLGDGSIEERHTPVTVSVSAGGGPLGGVTIITAGGYHTCAVANGAAKCWGDNESGQLGVGAATTEPISAPVQVSGLTSGVAAISAGEYHTCALLNDTTVKCWGYNNRGQLGDGTRTERWTPVVVTDTTSHSPLSGVLAITGGYGHTCALVTGGGIKCWGDNSNGQLGDGTTIERWTPVDVSGLNSGVAAVTAGGWHTCALMTVGGAKCWGWKEEGELGNGEFSYATTPVQVIGFSYWRILLPLVRKQ